MDKTIGANENLDKIALLENNLKLAENIITRNGKHSGIAAIIEGYILDRYKQSFITNNDGLTAAQQFHQAVQDKYQLGRRAADRRVQLTKAIFNMDCMLKAKHAIENNIAIGKELDDQMIEEIGLLGDFSTHSEMLRKAGILPKLTSDRTEKRGIGPKEEMFLMDRFQNGLKRLKAIAEEMKEDSVPVAAKLVKLLEDIDVLCSNDGEEEKIVEKEMQSLST